MKDELYKIKIGLYKIRTKTRTLIIYNTSWKPQIIYNHGSILYNVGLYIIRVGLYKIKIGLYIIRTNARTSNI